MQPYDPITRLLDLIAKLPPGLRADWNGTNHYELTSEEPEYWFLDFSDWMVEDFDSASVVGQRVGLLLDLAEAAKAAELKLRVALVLSVAALAVLAGLLFTPTRPAHAYTMPSAAKADPCRSERADWKRAQGARRVGRDLPRRADTAQMRLLQCERAHIR